MLVAPASLVPPPVARPGPSDWVRLVRPTQWLKNAFVLAPLLFSERLFAGPAVWSVLLAAGGFCMLASGVYVLNDLLDRPADRLHPRKRHRPVASGRIRPGPAAAVAGLLVAAGFAAVLPLPPAVAGFMAAYLANTLAYIVWLKHRVILDVLLIAIGFVLRLLAGCAAAGVEPTDWLLECGFALALVLGFGKRRAEVAQAGVDRHSRPALVSYTAAKLDTLLAVCTAVCLLAYMLYTVAPDTVARHGTDRLVYTVPLVAYGLFRYLFKAQEAEADGPTEILTADPVFALTGLLWGAAVLAVLAWK